jgi:hypothetical protein
LRHGKTSLVKIWQEWKKNNRRKVSFLDAPTQLQSDYLLEKVDLPRADLPCRAFFSASVLRKAFSRMAMVLPLCNTLAVTGLNKPSAAAPKMPVFMPSVN